MHKHITPLTTFLPLLLCSALTAQSVTSPKGFDTIEGSMVFAHWGGSRRFHQVDNTHLGTPMIIKSAAWRRNGGAATTAPARTFDLTVDMGRANFGYLSSTVDNNFLPGSRTTVFSQTAVSFPDWSANIPGPAPFDFVVPFAAPYTYLGTTALIIDFSYTNNTQTGSVSMDREYNGVISGTAGAVLGTGCVATGQTGAFAHTASAFNLGATPYPANGMRLLLGGSLAPTAAGSVLAFVDAVDANLTGVLCADLHALPLLMFILPANATGLVADASIGFAHDPSLVGAAIYSQLLAIDPAQTPIPAVVSNARRTTIPATTVSGVHATCYAWYALPSTTGVGTLFFGGGAVIRLGL